MAFVLKALGGDEALDPGGFGVGFLAFAFGLDFAADDEFADLRDLRVRIKFFFYRLAFYILF